MIVVFAGNIVHTGVEEGKFVQPAHRVYEREASKIVIWLGY
jgi:hypothetical protein